MTESEPNSFIGVQDLFASRRFRAALLLLLEDLLFFKQSFWGIGYGGLLRLGFSLLRKSDS
jgi:hypothetical protein